MTMTTAERNAAFAKLMNRIFEVQPHKRLRAGDWRPSHKRKPEDDFDGAGRRLRRPDDEDRTEELSDDADRDAECDEMEDTEKNMQSREQILSAFVKRRGIAALAKSVNAGGAFLSGIGSD